MPIDLQTEQIIVDLIERVHERYYGKYRGVVTNTCDCEGMGRIRARVPSVFGDEESPWAMPSAPAAGSDHGFIALPHDGEGVWIEFEEGDISRPIWSGCWWARGELPRPAGPDVHVLRTAGGHGIVLDDRNGIVVTHSDGPKIAMTSSEIKIEIGGTKIVLSASGVSMNNGALEVR